MRNFILTRQKAIAFAVLIFLLIHQSSLTRAQTPAFPGATGFGRFAKGARAVANPTVYVVTNLNDSGPGSFRDAVGTPGRIVVFAVGGIIRLASDVAVAANVTIAGQTAPGDGIVTFGKRVTFTGATNVICRYLRFRLGATGNSGKDASGLAHGTNMMFDHMSFSWGMDEVFSINWDNKSIAPDSITIQNSIIAQGLHRENHSAGGLIQTPDGGKVSLIRNLYISNKTRNPKVKGINEFVNNVVYDWGNGNRLGDVMNYGWSGDAYIMGGSAGVSEVNIINNYFMGGPLTPPDKTTPFSRGTGTFNLYGAGNYFDNNQNGIMDGNVVPYDTTGYPGIAPDGFKTQPYPYPQANPVLTAQQAYAWICDSAGACYPRRDEVDSLLAAEVRSNGALGYYVYRETDLPFANGGIGIVNSGTALLDSDGDGMPDSWEDAHGLNKNNPQDAVAYSTTHPQYLNIEVYINSLGVVAPVTDPQPVNNLTGVGYGNINLSWKGHGETYNIYVGASPDSMVLQLSGVVGNSFTLSNAMRLGTYFWQVDAVVDEAVAQGPTWSFTVVDTVPPTVITKNISVTLNGGTASITAADINNGSWDAYGIKSLTLDKTAFSCSNIGDNEVVLTAVDSNGNTASAQAIVTVAGSIPTPAITASRTNNTYTGGDANTIFMGYGAQQLRLTATNATPSQFIWDPATGLNNRTIANPVFTPSQSGDYTFTTLATNEFGCTATASVTITVIDARCGNNLQKVVVCHHGHDICIDKCAVFDHLHHGDRLASCSNTVVRVAETANPVEPTATHSFAVYPTPASASCTVSFTINKAGKYSVEVYNAQGQMLFVADKGEATAMQSFIRTINTSQLKTGAYFIKMVTTYEVRVKQMIIQR